MERRKNSRALTDIFVQFFEEAEDEAQASYHEGIIENYSTGGMYISTDHPFPRGSTILLNFRLTESHIERPLTVKVRAVVRWVRQITLPRGMGVEFLEVEGVKEAEFKQWLAALL
jgi:Tfp pilus assembly protein PilZ